MQFVLFEQARELLLPFTHTRSIADIRCGIFTMRERWEFLLAQKTGTSVPSYLQPIYPDLPQENVTCIDASVFATPSLVSAIASLKPGYKLLAGERLLAFSAATLVPYDSVQEIANELEAIQFDGKVYSITRTWDIFSENGAAIRRDFELLTNGRESQPIPQDIVVRGKEQVFLEEGAKINSGCVINATTGPVYLGASSEILEGVLIRGPLALGPKAVIKMGAKVYGDTTVGEGCKVGGEISNVVFFANSNKGHDGYLGNSVIGEWCNLGADTNCSNLKNNYDEVKVWDEQTDSLIKTGLTFCGLMMGDHSKCGINTMFNTGTVVGVSCNIYGAGFPPKFVPSFSWGSADGFVTYDLQKAMLTADRMMERRGKQLSAADRAMYQVLFQATEAQRINHHSKSGVGE